ncbi:hypothetical protein PMAYCL1PPCAC_14986, partial [Pristionchus mayeri]
FLLLAFTIAAVNADVWSAWTEITSAPCSDNCGYCGVRVVAERTCSTPGKCPGPSQRYEECGSGLCAFPRSTCCDGYAKGLTNGQFDCLALANIAAKTKLT